MSDRFTGAALTFALLLLISLGVGVEYLGLNAMDSLYADARTIVETQWMGAQLASELTYSNPNSGINMQIVVTSDQLEIDSLVDRAKHTARTSVLLQRPQSRMWFEKQLELININIEASSDYVTNYRQASDILLDRRNMGNARQRLMRLTLPLLKYRLAWGDFVRFQADDREEQIKRSAIKYVAVRTRTIY